MNTVLTLHGPQQARTYYASGVWQDQTLYALLQSHAQTRPGAWALRDSARRLTWAQLKRELVEWVKQGRLNPTPVRWKRGDNTTTGKGN